MDWISIEERVPEEQCLAINAKPMTYGYGEMVIGYVCKREDGYICESDYEILLGVTHWISETVLLKGVIDE
jgi:hypothetical protein